MYLVNFTDLAAIISALSGIVTAGIAVYALIKGRSKLPAIFRLIKEEVYADYRRRIMETVEDLERYDWSQKECRAKVREKLGQLHAFIESNPSEEEKYLEVVKVLEDIDQNKKRITARLLSYIITKVKATAITHRTSSMNDGGKNDRR